MIEKKDVVYLVCGVLLGAVLTLSASLVLRHGQARYVPLDPDANRIFNTHDGRIYSRSGTAWQLSCERVRDRQ